MSELRVITFYVIFLVSLVLFSGMFISDMVKYRVIKVPEAVVKTSPYLRELMEKPEKVGETLGSEMSIPEVDIRNISECRKCVELGGVWRWCKKQVVGVVDNETRIWYAWCQPNDAWCGWWDWSRRCWDARAFWGKATSCARTINECLAYEELK